MTIDLIPAALVHSALMAEMHKICFVDPWTEGGFAESLTAMGTHGLIAVDQNTLVPSATGESGPAGMVMWRTTVDEAEILTIAVLPPWRRRGLGQRLLQTALDAIAQTNVHTVFLEVAENNPVAQTLYRKHGFSQVGRRSGYYNSIDALVLRRVSAET